MANIKKIQVNGVEYEVYDEAAHRLTNRVRNEMPADLTENAQGRIILIDENGNPIGEGVSVSAKVDDLILEQEGDENKLFLAYQGETIGEGVVLPAADKEEIAGMIPTVTLVEDEVGVTITVTEENGETTSATVRHGEDGQDGYTPVKGVDYFDGADGQDGTSVTVSSVTESTESGGENVVTFSDGNSLTVKNGKDGADGQDGASGKDGKDYVLTEADKSEIAKEATALVDTSGFVAKYQDPSNAGKILVVGTDGKLTLTNMPEGGDVVGTLDDSNNILLSGNLASGTYTLKYEHEDGTYTEIGTLEVSAIVPDEPSYTNLATTFKTGWRFKSDGSETEQDDGCVCEDYIPFTNGTVVRIKGFGDLKDYNSIFYDTNKTLITSGRLYAVTNHAGSYTYDSANDVVTVTSVSSTAAFIRVSGVLTGTTGDVVITVNEPIV